jgi:hypothetical protein
MEEMKMKKYRELIAALMLTTSIVPAMALEVGDTFQFKRPAQSRVCSTLEKLNSGASCGTAVSETTYKVIQKSGDAVCFRQPEYPQDECAWAVIAPQAVAPKEGGRLFSDLRPWNADCAIRVSMYDRSTPITTMHLHVDTNTNTVTRTNEDGKTIKYKLLQAMPSRYSPFPDMELASEDYHIFMLATNTQLGGYAFYNRQGYRGAFMCTPYLDRNGGVN